MGLRDVGMGSIYTASALSLEYATLLSRAALVWTLTHRLPILLGRRIGLSFLLRTIMEKKKKNYDKAEKLLSLGGRVESSLPRTCVIRASSFFSLNMSATS